MRFSFETGPFFTGRKKVLELTCTQKEEDKERLEGGNGGWSWVPCSWQWLNVGPGGEIRGEAMLLNIKPGLGPRVGTLKVGTSE